MKHELNEYNILDILILQKQIEDETVMAEEQALKNDEFFDNSPFISEPLKPDPELIKINDQWVFKKAL